MIMVGKLKQNSRLYLLFCIFIAVLSMLGISSLSVNAQTQTEEAQSISLTPYLPYYHFIEYNYQGDQVNYPNYNMILEFNSDANGKFQIVAISDQSQTAIIYQLTDYGLYELARFENYMEVADLRYTPEASEGNGALIFPTNVSVGMTYQGGTNNASQFTISEILDLIEMNGVTYENVVVINEKRGEEQFDHYYAPDYGLIAVEQIYQDGTRTTVFQLSSTGGYLN